MYVTYVFIHSSKRNLMLITIRYFDPLIIFLSLISKLPLYLALFICNVILLFSVVDRLVY